MLTIPVGVTVRVTVEGLADFARYFRWFLLRWRSAHVEEQYNAHSLAGVNFFPQLSHLRGAISSRFFSRKRFPRALSPHAREQYRDQARLGVNVLAQYLHPLLGWSLTEANCRSSHKGLPLFEGFGASQEAADLVEYLDSPQK